MKCHKMETMETIVDRIVKAEVGHGSARSSGRLGQDGSETSASELCLKREKFRILPSF